MPPLGTMLLDATVPLTRGFHTSCLVISRLCQTSNGNSAHRQNFLTGLQKVPWVDRAHDKTPLFSTRSFGIPAALSQLGAIGAETSSDD